MERSAQGETPTERSRRVDSILTSQPLLEGLVDYLPVGVVLLDRWGRVVLFNRYEERLARRRREDVLGRSFFEEVAPCTNVQGLGGAFREHIAGNTLQVATDFEFRLAYLPRPREVRIDLRSFTIHDEVFAAFVVEDVTERRRLERERDEFYSVLVHDLRGDLGGVIGYAALLAEGSLGPVNAEQREALQTVVGAGERIEGRIASALATYRAVRAGEGQGAPLQRRDPVNLHALVLSSLAMARPRAAGAGLELIYEGHDPAQPFPDRAVATLGDVDKLGTLVDNLLGNALKYAARRVVVSLEEREGELRLAVRDDGPGIPALLREQVFAQGFQAPGAKPGSGIGLHSAQRVVEAHEGRIWADAAPEGGAALHVSLPALAGEV
ncbi:MAG: sensor histidine kinase [Planctomycetota bacterium]